MSEAAQPSAPAGRLQLAWFCTGNADERYTTLAVENLLVELASSGGTPLAVYSHSAPFSTAALRLDTRDRLARHLEHFGSARIPALRLDELCRHLSNPRRRALFIAEGARYSTVVVSGPTIPEAGLPTVADAIVLFIAKGTATASWVYKLARTLVAKAIDLPVAVVVLNAAHLEEAAVFYSSVRQEVVSLLGKELPIRFAGCLRFDPDYSETALHSGLSLVERYPTSPFHGQVKYVLKAISTAVTSSPAESYFSRMAALCAGSRGKTGTR